jgi:hypothetical protein
MDIRVAESRKQAFVALHDELAGAVRPRVQKAMSANSLPPMADVLPSVLDLAAVEYAAEGSAEDAKAILTDLGTHARQLMSNEIRRLDDRVGELHATANSFDLVTRGGVIEPRGLTSPERKELQDALVYLGKIEKSARDAQGRAKELGFTGEKWDAVVVQADDAAENASRVLAGGRS